MDKNQVLQAILDSVSEGVMALDKDWKIVVWNDAAERITGFQKEEVLGNECSSVFRSGMCAKQCLLDRSLTCNQPFHDVEATIRNKRHELIHLLVSAAPLYGTNHDIIGGLETFKDVSQHRWMQEELRNHLGYHDMVGSSPAMIKVFQTLASLMDTDTTVLIRGESGTGKELIARALHFGGPRREKSFVALSCSAIPDTMLESELFGYAKGAFTGAERARIGKFELANAGTLFLDEIGELSPSVQVKLLRVLEEREFQRLGENKSIKVDIRLITATNTNLYERVLDGSFRSDLYYRISVFPVDVPPLRNRVEDIPLLVNHFMKKFNKQMGKRVRGVADGLLETLESYPWPGNIRELRNAMEYAFVHCLGEVIRPADLPENILRFCAGASLQNAATLNEALESVEKELILNALETANWNKNVASKRLGLSVSTLWRRMQKYGMLRDNARVPRIWWVQIGK